MLEHIATATKCINTLLD